MSVGVQKAYSVTAASNASADTNINFAEGQTPASLNNSDRAQMAAIKGFANQILAAKTTGGSSNTYTFTSDSVAAIDTAYAAGMGFWAKANHSNTGAATLNVDGVGAKSIKKGGAQSALVATDIVSGGIYGFYYEASGDCFILVNPETGQTAAGNQPLDATLTALAALSWSSGNALVQFTAADTVSLTLAPSVTSITLTTTTASAPGVTSKNTTDAASVCVALWEGDRATPADNDEVYHSIKISDIAGNQDELWRWTYKAWDADSGTEDSQVDLHLATAGTLAARYNFFATTFRPNGNDGAALGDGSRSWSDLFLASGGVINWNNGNVTITHSAGLLAFSGAVQSRVPLSSETTGTLTSASANKKVVCTGGITLDDGVFTTDDFILFDPGTSSRTFTRAAGLTMYVNGTDSASATLAANMMGTAHWRSSTVVVLSGGFT